MEHHAELRLESIIKQLRIATALMNGLAGDDFIRLGRFLRLF
jgi:hypothetical protein